MTSKHNDGGPAFPETNGVGDVIPGMKLRDYFAAKATEEDIEAHREYTVYPKTGRRKYTMTREQAKYAYADAMLAARGNQQ